jgi:hypothetical protein
MCDQLAEVTLITCRARAAIGDPNAFSMKKAEGSGDEDEKEENGKAIKRRAHTRFIVARGFEAAGRRRPQADVRRKDVSPLR